MKHLLRELPPIHELQHSVQFDDLRTRLGQTPEQITKAIQQVINDIRYVLVNGMMEEQITSQNLPDYIWAQTEQKLIQLERDRITNVINATGTVLHTNLGRARLSEKAIEHVVKVAGQYSNLEYNVEEGKRGSRHDILEEMLVEVTGAEAAMIVNNNAAAVYLVLRALAKEKEVIVSRGQLVEIGGSFRVSSIMEESGAHLVEVGTTNKTHLYDYENAITEDTGMILKVHTSNFKTIGFTQTVESEALVELTQKSEGVIFYEDLGSGSIFDFREAGIGEEPVVREVIESGVDLVSFSGDKLLGGPQAGIIVGKKVLIDRLKKHQLARVLRVDKMTFAALEKTLLAYITGHARQELPTLRDILKPLDEIEAQCSQFITTLEPYQEIYDVEMVESTSQIGGGTMPDVHIPTFVVAVTHRHYTAKQLAEKIRLGQPAIIARIKDEKVLLDFRTISKDEMDQVGTVFIELAKD
ncbi:L-seryl-tRNA(Sec) selenium transferase [Aquibacillus koreensis]|uniref:L-seryl-tRNA(Sec) selenium transferase n=1 Tax=Aquibacillus koreensis TaxID=279446 RepID=A0A9X3WIL9_9BACI|nr:L-seryl-tRNA(Sec) selenium transferase [Aquibacillus koreensis]MCT2535996.1 L-seryl-tRNA(Sec) selenium transferase [Aquibacillus koreensis]MDC3420452.1 L-seryl-tRNA(Sec) selenium transferase [Aquibacillus koreensis]